MTQNHERALAIAADVADARSRGQWGPQIDQMIKTIDDLVGHWRLRNAQWQFAWPSDVTRTARW